MKIPYGEDFLKTVDDWMEADEKREQQEGKKQ